MANFHGRGDGGHPQEDTWRLTDRPASRRVLRGKWVNEVKNEVEKNGNNTTRHKVRLCFLGNRQIKGLDFNEMFAPVAKFTTIGCTLAMTAANGWEQYQMDAKTASLHGDLDEEVCMEQPDGYVDPTYPDKVCRLLKALYGLKQAPSCGTLSSTTYSSRRGLRTSTRMHASTFLWMTKKTSPRAVPTQLTAFSNSLRMRLNSSVWTDASVCCFLKSFSCKLVAARRFLAAAFSSSIRKSKNLTSRQSEKKHPSLVEGLATALASARTVAVTARAGLMPPTGGQ